MARHGFGRGEYKYFSLSAAAPRRPSFGPPFTTARGHRQPLERGLGIEVALPEEHPAFLRRCHRAGQPGRRPCSCSTAPTTTTACTRISTASMCSRSSSRSCSPVPARFHRGRIRPHRAAAAHASRAESCRSAVRRRRGVPGQPSAGPGARGTYRVNLRHGVSRLRSDDDTPPGLSSTRRMNRAAITTRAESTSAFASSAPPVIVTSRRGAQRDAQRRPRRQAEHDVGCQREAEERC